MGVDVAGVLALRTCKCTCVVPRRARCMCDVGAAAPEKKRRGLGDKRWPGFACKSLALARNFADCCHRGPISGLIIASSAAAKAAKLNFFAHFVQ
eukprot:6359666-Prymnesium_polylepis.1